MTWFFARTMGNVYSGRVLRFFGEALRQAGLLITGSVLIVLALVVILGLQCGIEGAYGAQTVGAKSAAGAFTALCNLREVTPYAFGYMMAAKVGTGMVAEIGSMRISDEIDALEVIGVPSVLYLCSTRLLGVWLVLPFVFVAAVAVGFLASALAVVVQVEQVSVGGYFQIFWQFQNPVDLLYSGIKAMAMATFVVLVGRLLRLPRRRRLGRGGHGHREVDGGEHPRHPRDRPARNPDLLGRQPALADRRMRGATTTRARAAAVTALVLAIVVVSIVLLGGGGGYELRAQFSNASQLVKGAQVHVAGRPVGTVTEIRLTENGLAEVVMEISDEDAPPMRRGARAQIRTGGLAGVANRFVVLRAGAAGRARDPRRRRDPASTARARWSTSTRCSTASTRPRARTSRACCASASARPRARASRPTRPSATSTRRSPRPPS